MMNFDYKKFSISRQILTVAVGLSIVLVIFLLSFSASQVVENKNVIKEVVSTNRSFGAVEKIDRNFYERFGDVQAFAYNNLAKEAIDSGKATAQTQSFINTMVSYYVLYDLMMIVNTDGQAIAVNTLDKNGVPVKTDFLIGMDFSNEAWFRTCISSSGPKGGAWYSDFLESQMIGQIYNSKGWGMAFAAPIKNDNGETIGVWYNFASWRDVTQDIRRETEELMKTQDPDAFILLTDKQGNVIDASDEGLVSNLKLHESGLKEKKFEFKANGAKISSDEYLVGVGHAKGAYTYPGNNWIAWTFIPKDKFSFSIFFGELFTLTITTILILIVGVITFLALSKNIAERIKNLQITLTSISIGELIEIGVSKWGDEIGQMTNSLRGLINGLRMTSLFANEIGNGNLDATFQALSEKDVLGNSLITMRDKLLKIKIDDERRKWVTQGLAEFGSRLRKNSDTIIGLCDDILVFLCKYVEANQGAIFIKDQNGEGEEFLKMTSCYAWDRKKFISEIILPGDGLIGQVWQEAQMIYMSEVPDGFVKITSGLGELNPNHIILLPLSHNDEVLGVLEMAFFKKIESHKIELLQNISISIAATLSSVNMNEKTKRLLEQTQQQAEEMRSQEEEMRQNMEELSATQEEMIRKEQEYIKRIEELEERTVPS